MRKVVMGLLVLLVLPMVLWAQDYASQINALIEKEGSQNCKKAVELALKYVQESPNSYEANWLAAKAHRQYGDWVMREQLPGWKANCKEYGRKGMQFGEKAIALQPNRPEGHFYYAVSVGTYADGVSVLTALKEGLKGKTQTGLENAYKVDKMFEAGGPIKALGRFWQVLPFPMKNKNKALQYLQEYNKLYPNEVEGLAFLGEAYIDKGDKNAARTVLTKAAASSDKYYSARAKQLLAGIN